ncbi:MAG: carboxypeptidase-like regulatory domain-containing protein, partial [Melioribacteraceae bacterium]|nr:carboxypeptidase-like regulatory domain-containing protein [Melioribacteraceae bacterium]
MRPFNVMNKCFIVSFIILLGGYWGCSEDNPVEPTTTNVVIIVSSSTDSSFIANANVVLYNANSGESVSRVFSGSDGRATFEALSPGNYYVRISAQGFKEIPQGSVSPVPFSVSSGQTFSQTYYMDRLQGTFGKIDGTVNPNLSGFLIVATSSGMNTEYHTYSGPDGYFVLFNVPYGTYIVDVIRSGYQSTNQPQVTLSAGATSATVQINVIQITGSTLTGKVTFLASQNAIVDISLLDKISHSVVNGLTIMIDTSRNYAINSIPDGEYIAWASYENDGYVMDPDWIFKNPGALFVSFAGDSSKARDFSVTDAITLIFPTNPAGSIIPALADTIIPTFSWSAYPQTKEYIVEVRDINGNLIWGGFTASGEIRHSQIPKEWNNVEFNFDGSASSPLQLGNIYQWRIYSDDDATQNVQTLLSSSEDLMG